MSNLALYVTGYVVVIAGLVYGAFLLGIPPVWIAVGAVILLGIGLVTGVSKTRHREASPEDPAPAQRVVVDEN